MSAHLPHLRAGRHILVATLAAVTITSSSAVRADDGDVRGSGSVAVPGITYSPDTGLAVFVGALRYFRVTPGARPSSVAGSFSASTGEDLTGEVSPTLWLDDDRLLLEASTELAHRTSAFFGVGNDTPSAACEPYRQLVAAAQLRAMRRLPAALYAGALYDVRHVEITSVEPGGVLEAGELEGSGGGLLSGVGLIVRLDTRDEVFFPTSGARVEISPRWYGRALGSDHQFWRFRNDARYYLGLSDLHVLAFHAHLDVRTGDPPFDHMSIAGGQQLLRGMLRGRFRDMVFAGAQLEYRAHIWRRFGAVAFGAAGVVAPELGALDLEGVHVAGGLGIRFAVKPEEKLNLRLDVAVSDVDTAVYLNIQEAF